MERGHTPYDEQSESEQALTRRRWDRQMAEERHRLNYAAVFEADGTPYSEADESGNLLRHNRTS